MQQILKVQCRLPIIGAFFDGEDILTAEWSGPLSKWNDGKLSSISSIQCANLVQLGDQAFILTTNMGGVYIYENNHIKYSRNDDIFLVGYILKTSLFMHNTIQQQNFLNLLNMKTSEQFQYQHNCKITSLCALNSEVLLGDENGYINKFDGIRVVWKKKISKYPIDLIQSKGAYIYLASGRSLIIVKNTKLIKQVKFNNDISCISINENLLVGTAGGEFMYNEQRYQFDLSIRPYIHMHRKLIDIKQDIQMTEYVTRIPPNQYIHVLDQNANTTRLETGPLTFIRKEHETIVAGPNNMINLPPRTYCKILNPIIKENAKPKYNEYGEVEIERGEIEYRTADAYPDPFPLYPGEQLVGKVESLRIVQQNTALRLIANRDFKDGDIVRLAGEEWQRNGPFTYVPRQEEDIVQDIKAVVIQPNTALKLRATRAFTDRSKVPRIAGENWLIRQTGSYLPDTFEEIVEVVKGEVLTDKQCLHLRAIHEFVDVYKVKRRAGDEWLVTNKQAQVHITDVFEEIVAVKKAITLSSRNYCVILNPYDNVKRENAWGVKVLIKGEKTFFLSPGEELIGNTVSSIEILGEDEALLVQAINDHKEDGKYRVAGDRWIIKGPREYIPGVEVQIIERRKAIPLDANEGIYVRDNRTGEVKEIKGRTYLLEAHESLWEKQLPQQVELLVQRAASGQPYVPPKTDAKGNLIYDQNDSNLKKRDKTRIISFKAQHNSAIQLYDYKLKKQRVVFGPDLVMLGPDEQFTVLSLSGGKPKQENLIQTLQLSLGPDFMTDQLIVETSDHAKLKLTLSYNWYFKTNKDNEQDAQKLFAVKDFVGDACKSIASRVRGSVSSINFEDFHNNSSQKIREAVFGKQAGEVRPELVFEANNLVITSVDIQGQEITDEKTRNQLSQSINLAIEISSKSQEMQSRHQALKLEQDARGSLERQKLYDQAKSEETKIKLLEQQAQSAKVKAEGEAVARSVAQTIESKIKAEAELNQTKLRIEALKVEQDAEIEQQKKEQDADISYTKATNELEIKKAKELSEIEIKKFKQVVQSIGRETIVAMARAGPETKAKLLSGLGLKGFLVTDGKNPINLFNTANGFIGGQQ